MKKEASDFGGCGLEMPDLFIPDNLEYFKKWEGDLRFVQNIKIRSIKKVDLVAGAELSKISTGVFDGPSEKNTEETESMDT